MADLLMFLVADIGPEAKRPRMRGLQIRAETRDRRLRCQRVDPE
jgi:hypothetical protein